MVLDQALIQSALIGSQLLDFLFPAGDFSLYVFLFLGFFGEVFQTERVLPQRGIKLFLYHIGQGIQQLFFKDKHTGTNALFDAVVADTVVDIYLLRLSADAFLPVKAVSTVGAEDFSSQKIRGPGMYFPVFGLLCSLVQCFLNSGKQLPADDGFMGAAYRCPFIGAGSDLLVVNDFRYPLHQIAGINFCTENFGNGAGLPMPIAHQILMGDLSQGSLVMAGREIPGLVQAYRDSI